MVWTSFLQWSHLKFLFEFSCFDFPFWIILARWIWTTTVSFFENSMRVSSRISNVCRSLLPYKSCCFKTLSLGDTLSATAANIFASLAVFPLDSSWFHISRMLSRNSRISTLSVKDIFVSASSAAIWSVVALHRNSVQDFSMQKWDRNNWLLGVWRLLKSTSWKGGLPVHVFCPNRQ